MEEVERKWKELEEVEIKRLQEEKEGLKREKRAEDQHVVELRIGERAEEWRRTVLAVPV